MSGAMAEINDSYRYPEFEGDRADQEMNGRSNVKAEIQMYQTRQRSTENNGQITS
jgi:hypothetical protein